MKKQMKMLKEYSSMSFLRRQESSLYVDLLDSCLRRNDSLVAFSFTSVSLSTATSGFS
ncbi:hypothetical protein GF312_17935 [Candidatus Poribacteria bacterium]|nr:hypothetical protein [Candidatus Poribacteria bacterium]